MRFNSGKRRSSPIPRRHAAAAIATSMNRSSGRLRRDTRSVPKTPHVPCCEPTCEVRRSSSCGQDQIVDGNSVSKYARCAT